MPDEALLSARYSRGKLILLTLAAFAFVAVGIALVIAGMAVTIAVGMLSIVFFGGCGVVGLLRLRERGDVLVIGADGILDRRIADRVIPWRAVAGMTELDLGSQSLFAVDLSEPVERYVTSPMKLRLLKTNKRFGFTADLYIADSALTASAAQIREALAAGMTRYT